MRMRLEVIRTLNDAVTEELEHGSTLEEALELLAVSSLLPDYEGQSLPFFSVIRWYLGEAAERVIKYSGDKL